MTLIHTENEISIYLEGDTFKINVDIPKKGMAYIDGQEVDAAYAELLVTGEPDYIIKLTSADDVIKKGEEYLSFDVVKRGRTMYVPYIEYIYGLEYVQCVVFQILSIKWRWADSRYTFECQWSGLPFMTSIKKEDDHYEN